MPAYEYECLTCTHHFEQRQKMSDLPVADCPRCGGAVKRQISGGAAVMSKASGPACADTGVCDRPAMSCGGGCACGH